MNIGSKLKIEKNIPINTVSKWADLADQMEPTDSVLFPDERTASAFRSFAYKRSWKFASRKQSKGTVRLWRTE